MRVIRPEANVLRTRGQRGRKAVLSRAWLALLAWRTSRRLSPTPEDVARFDFPSQVRGRGVRLTEWLRDRLRPGWLRVRRDAGRRDVSDQDRKCSPR